MRDRKFYIDSIKMDLFRVVTATGDVAKPPAVESAREFLEHSIVDFDKFPNNKHDLAIKKELERYLEELVRLQDPGHRLRWAEKVLTARCRLV